MIDSKDMDIETALKTIAFYMGYKDAFNPCDNPVGKNHELDKYLSLDGLIPVWENLYHIFSYPKFDSLKGQIGCTLVTNHASINNLPNYVESYKSTMTEAAVYATAKAIQCLGL